MKNNIGITVLLVFFLGACSSSGVDFKTTKSVVKNENWEIHVEKSVFFSEDKRTEESCRLFNGKLNELIDSLQSSLKSEADTFFMAFRSDTANRPIFNYELYVTDSVYMADKHYISLRVLTYTFTGGAHGMTNFYAFNYDVEKRQFLQPAQLLDMKKSAEIDALLKKNFKNPEGCFTEVPTLSNGYTAFNFSSDSVYFTYPQYVLGPYSCGYAQVSIPRTELKNIWK